MELGLEGKRVLVTGGTRGIGRAIVEAVTSEGASVAFCARNAQQVKDCCTHFARQEKAVFGDAVDIANRDALKAWVNRAAEELGGIDVVVANPSSFAVGTSEGDWQSGYAVDLMGTVHTVEAATPYLEAAATRSGDASVLIVSSVLIAETDSESAYGAYKAALVHYAKGVSRRLAPKKVRVNTVSPGTIYFDEGYWGNIKQNMPPVYDAYLKRNPLGRMGSGEEVANAAVFLCAPVASFITGSNIIVDGGLTSRVNY
jgi:3-oxoacyl-[acyl-carrier protein] reductase